MTRPCLTSLLAFALSTGFLDQVAGVTVYTISKAARTWNEARGVCGSNGGHLVTFHNDTEWNIWKFLMGPDIDLYPRPSSTYWIGLHQPDPDLLGAYHWDTCDIAQYTEPLVEEPLVEDIVPTYHQCVYAWFHREVFNLMFMDIWLKGKACNETHAFICSIQHDAGCVSSCDEIVVPDLTETGCTDACSETTTCTASFNATLSVCHLKVNRTQNQDYLNICWLSSPEYNISCPEDNALAFDTRADMVDENINVTNTICQEQDPGAAQDPITNTLHNVVGAVQDPITNTLNNVVGAVQDPITNTLANVVGAAQDTINNTLDKVVDTLDKVVDLIEEPVCLCSCQTLQKFLAEPVAELANLTVEQKIDILVKNLTIDKKNTTSSQRKFVSVMDYRPSHVGLGAAGVGVIVGILGVIVIIDLSRLWHEVLKAVRKIAAIVEKNKVHASKSETTVEQLE